MVLLLSLVLIAYAVFCVLSAMTGGNTAVSLAAGVASAVTAYGFLLRRSWSVWTWYALSAWTVGAWAYWILPTYLENWAKPNLIEYFINFYPSAFPVMICVAGSIIVQELKEANSANTNVKHPKPALFAKIGFSLILIGFSAMLLMAFIPLASYLWLGATLIGISFLFAGSSWLAVSAIMR